MAAARSAYARCSALVTGHAGRETPRPCRLWAVVGDARRLCWRHAKQPSPPAQVTALIDAVGADWAFIGWGDEMEVRDGK